MSTVKSFSVGNGDTFYIRHNTDNFSIIDCHLSDENRERIADEIADMSADKTIVRFISTHPDEDHLKGLKYLDDRFGLTNFYCVENAAQKEDESDDFIHYTKLRDSKAAYYIEKNCKRRWMNLSSDERNHSGIHIHWPDRSNEEFQTALEQANSGGSPNNISAIISYEAVNSGTFMWLGDLETDYMDAISGDLKLPKVHILFAAHHGRKSGRVPHSILDKIKPDIIVLGEAPSRHLHYYGNYDTILQNSAGDITFVCEGGAVHIFVSSSTYVPGHLTYVEGAQYLSDDYYVGSLIV